MAAQITGLADLGQRIERARDQTVQAWERRADMWEQLMRSATAAAERCLGAADHCLGTAELRATQSSLQAEVAALRVRSEAAELDAEAARRKLRRTQMLCANNLYDVRSRCLLRLCFHAFARSADAGGHVDNKGGNGGGNGSSSPVRKRYGDGGVVSWPWSPADALADSPLPAHRRSLMFTINGSPLRVPASSAGLVTAPTTAALTLSAAEMEELHEAQISSLHTALATRNARALKLLDGVRRRHLRRSCLHALRAHASENIAFRGMRAGVLVALAIWARRVARAILCAWRLAALRGAEERERTSAISAVVSK